MPFSIACIGAGVLGLLLGWVFAWSTRKPEPTGQEVAALVSTVLGGAVLQLLDQINCPERLPIYIIGVAVGYALYLIVLRRNFTRINHFMQNHGTSRAPILPWTIWRKIDPCCNHCNHCNHCNTNQNENP